MNSCCQSESGRWARTVYSAKRQLGDGSFHLIPEPGILVSENLELFFDHQESWIGIIVGRVPGPRNLLTERLSNRCCIFPVLMHLMSERI